jgi:transketolase
MILKKEILEYSYKHNLGHIPSALSMSDYIECVFKYIKRDDKIVIGKPFGAAAYYIAWKNKGWLKDIDNLHMGLKHDEIPFVDYSEETIGNALGVASGIALGTDKTVYVNITDASLQMGNTLEAFQFIGQHKKKNILCTVDFNNAQVTGTTKEIIDVQPVISLARLYNWNVYIIDGHDKNKISQGVQQAISKSELPSLLVCVTQKGKGIKCMENDIKKWHYKKIETKDELDYLISELNE